MHTDPDAPTTLASRAGTVLVIATVAACAALLVLWHRSFRSFDEVMVPGPGGELRVASNDGAVIIGVFRDRDPDRRVPLFWRRPWRSEYARLLDETIDNPLPFAISLRTNDVGVVVPHWALAIPPALASAWWLLGDRRRHLLRHRRAHGLCGQCGYDLRASRGGRCPECGMLEPAPPALAGG